MSEEMIHAGGGLSITQPARREFDDAQLALIRDTVAKDCNVAELHLFLETCARHQLDPIIRQIWTIKYKGVMTPVVARDGLLAIANRHTKKNGYEGEGTFLGCQSDCVREHDFFDKTHTERARWIGARPRRSQLPRCRRQADARRRRRDAARQDRRRVGSGAPPRP